MEVNEKTQCSFHNQKILSHKILKTVLPLYEHDRVELETLHLVEP